jgi:hypothetical protein
MRFCFKSTISVLHCFNIDGFEQWSTIRERIYQKLFVEGKKIDIEICVNKQLPSLTKYLSGVFSIEAFFGVFDVNGSISLDIPVRKIELTHLLSNTDCIVLSRVPCTEAERNAFADYYHSITRPNSNYFLKNSETVDRRIRDRFFWAVDLLREIADDLNSKTMEMFEQMRNHAVISSVDWNYGNMNKKAWTMHSVKSDLPKAPSGIPKSMLRKAEEGEKNAMKNTMGGYVLRKI